MRRLARACMRLSNRDEIEIVAHKFFAANGNDDRIKPFYAAYVIDHAPPFVPHTDGIMGDECFLELPI